MKTLFASILVTASAVFSPLLAAQLDLKTGSFTVTFTDFTSASVTASNLTFSGNDQSTLSGSFSSFNIGSASTLTLTGALSSNPSSNFQILLFDSSDDFVTYTGNWAGFNTTSYVTLNLDATNAAFDGTAVKFTLLTAGAGSSLAGSLTSLSSIPEPSTYGLILGGVALGLVGGRRRRPLAA